MNANEQPSLDAVDPQESSVELEFRFDDHEDPSEVTIFDPETMTSGATEWVTIDHEHAVPLDEMR